MPISQRDMRLSSSLQIQWHSNLLTPNHSDLQILDDGHIQKQVEDNCKKDLLRSGFRICYALKLEKEFRKLLKNISYA